DRNAIQIIKLSLCITLFVSSVLYLFLILFNNQIIKLFNLNDVSIFLYLVPLTIGFAGIMHIVDQWIIRKKKFIVNAKVSLIQSFAINSGKIGVGYFHPFASVLIIFTAFTDAVRTLLLSLFLYRSPYDKKYDDNEKKLSIKQTV